MRQHTTDRTCWCEPRLEEQPDGRMLVRHDDATWTGPWGTYPQENGDVVVRPAHEEGTKHDTICLRCTGIGGRHHPACIEPRIDALTGEQLQRFGQHIISLWTQTQGWTSHIQEMTRSAVRALLWSAGQDTGNCQGCDDGNPPCPGC